MRDGEVATTRDMCAGERAFLAKYEGMTLPPPRPKWWDLVVPAPAWPDARQEPRL